MQMVVKNACSPTAVDFLRVKSLKQCTATAGRPLKEKVIKKIIGLLTGSELPPPEIPVNNKPLLRKQLVIDDLN